jgi:hypothetical protein
VAAALNVCQYSIFIQKEKLTIIKNNIVIVLQN